MNLQQKPQHVPHKSHNECMSRTMRSSRDWAATRTYSYIYIYIHTDLSLSLYIYIYIYKSESSGLLNLGCPDNASSYGDSTTISPTLISGKHLILIFKTYLARGIKFNVFLQIQVVFEIILGEILVKSPYGKWFLIIIIMVIITTYTIM